MLKEFESYSKLWKAIGNFFEKKKKWISGPVSELDSADVEFIVKENLKNSNRLLTNFNEKSIAYNVATKFRDDVVSMNDHLQTIEV